MVQIDMINIVVKYARSQKRNAELSKELKNIYYSHLFACTDQNCPCYIVYNDASQLNEHELYASHAPINKTNSNTHKENTIIDYEQELESINHPLWDKQS